MVENRSIPTIAEGQAASGIDNVYQDLGPVSGEAGTGDRVGFEFIPRVHTGLEERLRPGYGDGAGAPDGHGFEFLGTHHRADTAAAGSPVLVVHNAGKEASILPGGGNAGDPELIP